MLIKTPTRFEPFCDGVCAVHALDENNSPTPQPKMALPFDDRVVGSRRYFAAKAAQTRIERIIRTPQATGVSANDVVLIGGQRYEIEQIQRLDDTNPPCMDFTLTQLGGRAT